MTAQEEREREIASVLKAIYDLYGGDLSKFFGQIIQHPPVQDRLDLENVGRVVRRHDGRHQPHQASRLP